MKKLGHVCGKHNELNKNGLDSGTSLIKNYIVAIHRSSCWILGWLGVNSDFKMGLTQLSTNSAQTTFMVHGK